MPRLGPLDGLHVIAVIENPALYKSRYENYEIFQEDITRKGATLWTVELSFGDRPCRITKSEEEKSIQLWTSARTGEIWHKENLINIAMQFITRQQVGWRYVAWVDADVKFEPGSLERTVEALQTWDIVQMWSHLINLGPDGETVGGVCPSFMYAYWNKLEVKNKNGYLFGGAPGLAWAARRDAMNKLGCFGSGPLLDFAILGSGDRNFACALLNRVEESLSMKFSPNYLKWMRQYQDNAQVLKQNVGYVTNTVRHLFHGKKEHRGYTERWKILENWAFDPETDLRQDVSGVWHLIVENARQIGFRDDARRYMRSRREDGRLV